MSSAHCTKNLSITIQPLSYPRAYIAFEGSGLADQSDSITGTLLTSIPGTGGTAGVAGKVNLAVDLNIATGFHLQSPSVANGGNGFSFSTWFKWDANPGYAWGACPYWFFNTTVNDNIQANLYEDKLEGDIYVGGAWFNLHFNPAAAVGWGWPAYLSRLAWHMFTLTYNQSDKLLRYDIDNGWATGVSDVGLLNFTSVPTTTPDLGAYFEFATGSNQVMTWDEMSLWPVCLTSAQISYLYNSGAGRTWPITLPP